MIPNLLHVGGIFMEKKQTINENFFLQGFILIVVVCCFGFLSIYFGQDNTWDTRNYHFYNGFAYVNHRLGWDFAPAMVQSYLNPIFDVVNYYLIRFFNAKLVALFHGALTGLTVFLVYKIACILFSDTATTQRSLLIFFSVLIGATSSDNLSIVGLLTNDAKVAFFVIFSLYLILKAMSADSKNKLFYYLTAGFLLGLVTAFKLTSAIYSLSFSIIIFGFTIRRQISLLHMISFGLAVAVGFIVGDGYWMFGLYKAYGSPLFPYYNNIFHSPYAPNGDFQDRLYYPHDYLIFPYLVGFFRNSTVEHLRDLRYAIIYTLGILYIFKLFRTNTLNTIQAFLLIWFTLSYVIWFFDFTIFRYLLPLDLLTGVIMVLLLNRLIPNSKTVVILLCLICVALYGTNVMTRFDRTTFGNKFFSAQVPDLPDNAVVFLQPTPIAYTIPFFNPKVHFVGNLDVINKEKLNAVIRENISNVYSMKLKRDKQDDYLASYLKSQYQLVNTNECQQFVTNIGDEIEVCKVSF